jgi:hypothetical protein
VILSTIRKLKDGDTVGIEDPKKKSHLMSEAPYALTMLAASGTMYDPHKKAREGERHAPSSYEEYCALERAEQSRNNNEAQRNA